MNLTRKDIEEMIVAAKAVPVQIVGPFEVYQHVNLCMADLSGLDLSGLDLAEANLHGIKAVKTNFEKTNLRGANMHGADLDGANLSGADLDSANLCQACACDADFTDAKLKGVNFSEVCYEDAKGLDIKIDKKVVNKVEQKIITSKSMPGSNLHASSPIHED